MNRRRNLIAGWTAAVLLAALFAYLGTWQARRAVEKQRMLDAAAKVLALRQAVPLSQAADPTRAHEYDWAAGAGRFDAGGPLWLDNQQRRGRTGVRVYRVFTPEHSTTRLLVDLGWLPLTAQRVMPATPQRPGRIELRGLLAPPPSPGLALGPGIVRHREGWLLTRVEPDAITQALDLSAPLAPRVLRLDPAMPMGHERDLELLANTLPPEKHRGYSLQWFALAAAVLTIALILTFRKARRHEQH